jgi:hypothetical protein
MDNIRAPCWVRSEPAERRTPPLLNGYDSLVTVPVFVMKKVPLTVQNAPGVAAADRAHCATVFFSNSGEGKSRETEAVAL